MRSNTIGLVSRHIYLINCFRKQFSSGSYDVKKLSDKISAFEDQQRKFEYEHQRTLGITTVPNYASKTTKELAESRPWDGEETPVETSKRMLEDSIKPLKISRPQRLSNARENALDYTLNKAEGPTHKERLVSSQKARRNFGAGSGGKAISGLSSGGWVESVASQEIENARARGQFADIPRGTTTFSTKDALIDSNRNPQIDFTEYILNNIIRKQGGAPPWIMKQQAVRERVARFREQMRRRLQERLVHKITELANYDVPSSVRLAKLGTHNKDEEWEMQYRPFQCEAVDDINRQIRGYNLQAPPTARKGYLDVESEIKRCYATVTEGIEEEIAKYVGTFSVPKADKNRLHSSAPPLESPEKHYGLRQLFRDLFARE